MKRYNVQITLLEFFTIAGLVGAGSGFIILKSIGY